MLAAQSLQIFVFDDNVFLSKRYVINCYVYNTRFTHSKIVMYITPFVFRWLTFVICDPCYIHNSVITIAAKGMSTNCYVYNTVVLYHLRCFICDPCYIHNSVIKIAAKGMSIKCYVYNTVTKTTCNLNHYIFCFWWYCIFMLKVCHKLLFL